ncbi:hypothetical protein FNV43_RR09560 [Rhamnella rubrinervis]|uniref:Uncharacterized protein n=1 Tax=Rhamnella rubrinervis TaxID=2594499 RepID=A0A8K0MJ36_9ROSA|nr:hypothetical protein FNV43_RR08613 [Rhamnella rubrinervis]KAF3448846.1 hypothetical protein FNV43_RR09560 [Rhamnella rubrinervis]
MGDESEFGARAGNYVIRLVTDRLDYIIHYGRNLDNLKDRLEELVEVKGRVESKVSDPFTSKKGKFEAEKWVKRAEDIIAKAQKLLEDENHAHMCFYGLCANFIIRYDPSVKASRLAQQMAVEIQEGEGLC